MRLEEEYELLPQIKNDFVGSKIIVTKSKVRDIVDANEQTFLMITEHNRAHRGIKENYLQIKSSYFWPEMKRQITAHVGACPICLKNKYERHPTLQMIGETPIPKTVGEILHVDIFHIANKQYLTCVDKYSKFLQILEIHLRVNIPSLIEQLLIAYPNCKSIITDNDATFTSQLTQCIFRRYKIEHFTTPPGHSTTNGQIERIHSTILELARALSEQHSEPIADIIFLSAREYNNTIHSVTNRKPSEVFFHSDKFPQIPELIKRAQDASLKFHNKKRVHKEFEPGDDIYVKTDRRNKIVPRYSRHTVLTNNRNTVTTTANRDVHKDRIRK